MTRMMTSLKGRPRRMVVGKEGNPNPAGEEIQEELKHVKKEAVEKVLENQNNGNPTPNGIQSSAPKGDQELVKANSTIPSDQRTDEGANKESTIDWVHRRQLEDFNEVNSAKALWSDEVEFMKDQLGTTKATLDKVKRDNNQLQKSGNPEEATVNPSSPKTRADCNSSSMMQQSRKSIGSGKGLSKEAGNQSGSGQLSLSKKKGNGTVNPSKIGEMLAFVDGVPMYALEKGLNGGVHMKAREDTVGSYQQTGHGKEGDPNGTDVVSSIKQNKGNEQAKEQFEQAIVPRAAGEVEVMPMACESGTGQIMQLHLNVPLKTPLQHLHDLVTHTVAQIEEYILRQNPMEDEGDDESTAGNFKEVAKEANLSPTASAKGGKKTKKNQNKEPIQPSRIMPRRATSLSK
ncbi:hypothetical protein A4A49_06360 [Nicotiana attenuata]|uniref:Uncharacterized protein n=1 Tax=Nicotiana attenuata TaxID=49451 RepID=A0A314LH74_NICAT|nr:hypothetical protein A4A49_06360 [Nicotiana attenuata]